MVQNPKGHRSLAPLSDSNISLQRGSRARGAAEGAFLDTHRDVLRAHRAPHETIKSHFYTCFIMQQNVNRRIEHSTVRQMTALSERPLPGLLRVKKRGSSRRLVVHVVLCDTVGKEWGTLERSQRQFHGNGIAPTIRYFT